MKLYYEILKLLINKYIKRYETGIAIKILHLFHKCIKQY